MLAADARKAGSASDATRLTLYYYYYALYYTLCNCARRTRLAGQINMKKLNLLIRQKIIGKKFEFQKLGSYCSC